MPPTDDVVDKIEHDHREVEQLFDEFESSGDRAVALKISEEHEIHTAAEESAVYPVIAAEAGEEAEIADAEEEHDEARELIGRIRQSESDEELRTLVDQLKTAVEQHVYEEETDILPKARNEMPESELEELGDRFDEAKDASSS
jgi:iron-sulfur cluster repair protein YtfE (RIC family)